MHGKDVVHSFFQYNPENPPLKTGFSVSAFSVVSGAVVSVSEVVVSFGDAVVSLDGGVAVVSRVSVVSTVSYGDVVSAGAKSGWLPSTFIAASLGNSFTQEQNSNARLTAVIATAAFSLFCLFCILFLLRLLFIVYHIALLLSR